MRSSFSVNLVLASLVSAGVGSAAQAADKYEAFRTSVYAYVHQVKTCAGCHYTGNNETGDKRDFASDEIEKAYESAKRFISAEVEKSVLVVRAMNGHCNSNKCKTDGTLMIEALKKWKAGDPGAFPDSGTTPDERVVTVDLPLPTGLTDEQFMTMRWDLSKVTPAASAVQGAIFEVEIRGFGPGGFLLRKPRLATSSERLRVGGVRVVVDGASPEQPGIYEQIDEVIEPATYSADPQSMLPHPVLSARTQVVVDGRRPRLRAEASKLALSFLKLHKVAEARSCRSMELFRSNVQALLVARNCAYCHGGGPENLPGSSPAKDRLNFAVSDEAMCMQAIQRTNRGNANNIPWIAYPVFGANRHPKVIPLSDDPINSFAAWYVAEDEK